MNDFGAIVAAGFSGMDGNPPFRHGEKLIGSISLLVMVKVQEYLTAKKCGEFN
jgi:hypothetical protein